MQERKKRPVCRLKLLGANAEPKKRESELLEITKDAMVRGLPMYAKAGDSDLSGEARPI